MRKQLLLEMSFQKEKADLTIVNFFFIKFLFLINQFIQMILFLNKVKI